MLIKYYEKSLFANEKNLKEILGTDPNLIFTFDKVEKKFLEQDFGETEMIHISEVVYFANHLLKKI